MTNPETTQPPQNVRAYELDGMTYQTNLPDGVNPFEATNKSYLGKPLLPSELDKLPVGELFVSSIIDVDDEWGQPQSEEVKREIKVSETEHGKVIINLSSFRNKWEMGTDSTELMTALGFVVDNSNAGRPDILAAPTPDTVKAAAAKLGVDIEFFAGLTGLIQGRDYLGAYAAGKYAASTSNELDFMHDIQDDHLTSMVLGGEPLKEALMTSAGEALATDDEDIIDMRTADIDRFTATLRAVTSAGSNLVGESYGKESGRRTLINIGADIDLPAEAVQKILETAQENAKKFGITPKELA